MVCILLVVAEIFNKSNLTDKETETIISVRNEPRREKTNVLVSDLVRHRLGCTTAQDGWRLEILHIRSRGIVLYV